MDAKPIIGFTDDIADMGVKHAGPPLGEVLAQGFVDHGEGELLPGNLFLGE